VLSEWEINTGKRKRKPQRKKMMFNTNHYVRVKLTDAGYQHLKKIEEIYRLASGYTNAEDENGCSRWQLWDLMHTFGAAMLLGIEPPFETDIEIIEGQ
jgi:hypothetical protein